MANGIRAKFTVHMKKKVLDQGKTAINGPSGAWNFHKHKRKKTGFHFFKIGGYGRVVHFTAPRINDWPDCGTDKDGDGMTNRLWLIKK
jgi:hypothetical protein